MHRPVVGLIVSFFFFFSSEYQIDDVYFLLKRNARKSIKRG